MTCNPKILLQQNPPDITVVYFREERARSSLQVEADRKPRFLVRTGCTSLGSLQITRSPSPMCPLPWDTEQIQEPPPTPCTQVTPILIVTAHLGSAEHSYKRATLNLLFKLMLILHQVRWGAEVQNISFSILCYECQFCPCICILSFLHRFNFVRFHELHLTNDVQQRVSFLFTTPLIFYRAHAQPTRKR